MVKISNLKTTKTYNNLGLENNFAWAILFVIDVKCVR